MLPDLIRPGLRLVVCGTAVSPASARLGKYYAGHGNKFWKTLHEVGLTPLGLSPETYERLLDFGIGLTDLAKKKSGLDDSLTLSDFAAQRLTELTKEYRPRCVCFNGKRAAQEFLQRSVGYGLARETIDQTILFVAPSTSGSANRWWDSSYWAALAQICQKP